MLHDFSLPLALSRHKLFLLNALVLSTTGWPVPTLSGVRDVGLLRCPLQCSQRGTCWSHANDDFPNICLCDKFWQGPACAERQINPFPWTKVGNRSLPSLARDNAKHDAWLREAGVACGGARHAVTCAGCQEASPTRRAMDASVNTTQWLTDAERCRGECSWVPARRMNTRGAQVVMTKLKGECQRKQSKGGMYDPEKITGTALDAEGEWSSLLKGALSDECAKREGRSAGSYWVLNDCARFVTRKAKAERQAATPEMYPRWRPTGGRRARARGGRLSTRAGERGS